MLFLTALPLSRHTYTCLQKVKQPFAFSGTTPLVKEPREEASQLSLWHVTANHVPGPVRPGMVCSSVLGQLILPFLSPSRVAVKGQASGSPHLLLGPAPGMC